MFIKRLIPLTTLLVLAATTIAPAATVGYYSVPPAQPDGNKPKTHGGAVHSDGSIALGSGFTVVHPSMGKYEITYPLGTFKGNCPVISLTTWGYANGTTTIAVLQNESCSSGLDITIEMRQRTDGTLVDNGFQFVANPVS